VDVLVDHVRADAVAVFLVVGDGVKLTASRGLPDSFLSWTPEDDDVSSELGRVALARLRDAGFVTSHRQGIWAFYRLRDDMPATARAALALIP